ncbi:hypothetical protein MD484_g1441, partial [Candolleomyces efflorescens]
MVASTSKAVFGSPSKRARRMASFPQTPTTLTRTTKPATNPFVTPARARFAPLYPLQACDSPSNPFGRKHCESLIRKLPPSTSFSKHLALRFQFVRKGVPFNGGKPGGVCRVVQVPLSYTFVHLRCLISFLFDGPGTGTKGKRVAEDNDHLFEIKKDVEKYNVTYKPGQIKNGKTWAKLSSTRDPCRWRAEENEIDEDDDDDEDIDEAEEAGRDFGEGDHDWEWKDEEDFTLEHAWPDGLNESRGIVYFHSRTTQVHITINTGRVERRRGSGNTPYVFSAKGRVGLTEVPLQRVLFKDASSSAKGKGRETQTLFPRSGRATRSSSRLLQSTIATAPSKPAQRISPDLNDEDDELDGLREFDENHPFNLQKRGKATRFRDIEDEVEDDDDDQGSDEDNLEDDFYVDLDPKKWNKPNDAFAVYLGEYMGPAPPPSGSRRKPINLFNDDEDDVEVDQLADDDDQEEFEEVQDDTLIVYRDDDDDDLNLSSTPGLTFSSSSPHRLPLVHPSSSPAHFPPLSSSPQRPSVRFDASADPEMESELETELTRELDGLKEFPSPSVFLSPSIIFPRRAFKDKMTPAPKFRGKRHRKRWERVERLIEKSMRGKVLRLKVGEVEGEEEGEEADRGEEQGGGEGEERNDEGDPGERADTEGDEVEVKEEEIEEYDDDALVGEREEEEVDQLDEDEDEYDTWRGCVVGSSEI